MAEIKKAGFDDLAEKMTNEEAQGDALKQQFNWQAAIDAKWG